jgi:hypothetical protein
LEGNLNTMPLVNLLEMLHDERKSGVLRIRTTPPLTIHLQVGEVVDGGILDWKGMDAIASYGIHTPEGAFHFEPGLQSGRVIMPMRTLLGEWARINDECHRFFDLIDSPSRVFESLGGSGTYEVFVGGRSVRTAARMWEVPLVIAMERVWTGLQQGELTALNRYVWYKLRIRHPRARRSSEVDGDLIGMMDGEQNLGRLVATGINPGRLRRYLIKVIMSGELVFSGRGWLLRDLLWELEHRRK